MSDASEVTNYTTSAAYYFDSYSHLVNLDAPSSLETVFLAPRISVSVSFVLSAWRKITYST
ncbi:hypothetical protein AALP_AAs72214U000100 [Arabis alpina]|uniref:Uncharacterized protein n=1 Tax=Arabis alpina TaxID=50452 RepID=A0A087G0N3_ARAAL|nr:hypothetical protein AALP_AAs72214U000100 [Arabis alpina]